LGKKNLEEPGHPLFVPLFAIFLGRKPGHPLFGKLRTWTPIIWGKRERRIMREPGHPLFGRTWKEPGHPLFVPLFAIFLGRKPGENLDTHYLEKTWKGGNLGNLWETWRNLEKPGHWTPMERKTWTLIICTTICNFTWRFP
jgi:hypothetical protein